MAVIDLEKTAARRLGCGAAAAGGYYWRTLLLLVVLATSAAAFVASFSSDDRFAAWFSALPSPFSTSSAPPPSSSPVASFDPTAPRGFLAHSPSPVGDSAASYEGEDDPKVPPLGHHESVLTPSPSSAPVAPPSPLPRVSNLAKAVNSTDNDGTSSPTLPESVSTNTTTSSPLPSPTGISTDAEVNATSPVVKAPTLLRETDLQLIRAKKEIAGSPVVLNGTDLYAPLFLNVSVFKRSYEMMERTLKVYIYEDGPKPLFHTPALDGIYASEGWFMKLMEENKQFVVKNPNEAHLFYLPYSSRQLRTHLYVPDSRSLRPLSIFLRDYINSISAKYPFWNRTRGADHFFVGCHDWATYTTNLHGELRNNTIKAVCNADVSEGIFVRGKDVSLPETYIRTPKRPQQGIGGKPASKRSILAFFAGQMHGRVRPILLQHWKGKDKDMRIYEVLPKEIDKNMSYVEHMRSSKYCICPMGYEVNSPRIVEAFYSECVPVIIADNFVLPFEEVLDWSSFSVVVAEKDIPKLKEILLGISPRKYATMQMNVKKLKKHFLWNEKPMKYDLFHMILHSIWFNRLNQIQLQ